MKKFLRNAIIMIFNQKMLKMLLIKEHLLIVYFEKIFKFLMKMQLMSLLKLLNLV